ncbi:MAG: J domain-containing protein [Caldilineaceae bacterium]
MKDYYEILDVPLTATREEIKAQYKQLVRIYHPDRFRDSADKAYAEEKLKQINIAFQVLCGVPMQPTMEGATVAPQPVAYPPVLDFGAVPAGTKRTLSLQVGNLGGEAATVQLRCPGASQAVRISKGKRIYADRPFPLTYEVSVDAHRLRPNTTLQEWIEIDLAGVVTQVELRLQVTAAPQVQHNPSRRFALSKRWLAPAVATLVLGLAAALSPAVGSLLSSDGFPTTLFARPSHRLAQHNLLFALQEQGLPALYLGGEAGSEPQGLGISGRAAVGSVAGQRVAYLGSDGEVHLLDSPSGESRN